MEAAAAMDVPAERPCAAGARRRSHPLPAARIRPSPRLLATKTLVAGAVRTGERTSASASTPQERDDERVAFDRPR